jgi:hypothetical protein
MESTLSLNRDQLRQAVGIYAGFGPTYSSYSSDSQAQVDLVIDAGLRSFYDPLPLPGEKESHVWSFRTPLYSQPLSSAVIDYDLPDDFAGLVDHRAYLSADDQSWTEINVTNVVRMLNLRQRDTQAYSGAPTLIAVQVKPSNGQTPTRWQLMVWPAPDGDYSVRLRYVSNPYQLSAGQPYPLGGQPHSETIREAVLAAAEREFDGEMGIHNQQFAMRLLSSVSIDRRASGPAYLGYCGDRSGESNLFRDRWNHQPVTVNGVIPE